MKKLLALVLALVMTLSLATVSTNAAFEDADDISYEEAAGVLSAVGVFVGDGKNFNPKAALNREQAAKLVAYMALGEDVAEALPALQMFDDVAASSWAAKYIAYCADAGIITGDGAGKFYPAAPVDGYAFSKMLLCALGYKAEAEGYTGSNWSINVARDAKALKLTAGFNGKLDANLTREEAAQLMFNAIKCQKVTYSTPGTSVTVGGIDIQTAWGDPSLGAVYYVDQWDTNLTYALVSDDFGRTANQWSYEDFTGVYADDTADFVITEKMTAKEVATLLKGYKVGTYEVTNDTADALSGTGIVNYVANRSAQNYTFSSDTVAAVLAQLTGDGTRVEIFSESGKVIDQVVVVTYSFGEIDDITTNSKTGDVTYSIKNYGDYTVTADTTDTDPIVFVEEPAEGDYVTYVAVNSIVYVYPTTTVTGDLTSYNEDLVYTIAGDTYTCSTATGGDQGLDFTTNAKFWLDQYGFVVNFEGITTSSKNYAYIMGYENDSDTTFGTFTADVKLKVLLSDGTVGIYNAKTAKKGSDYYIVDADGNPAVAGKVISDANLASDFQGKVFSYVLDGNTIALNDVTALSGNGTEGAFATTLYEGLGDTKAYVAKNDTKLYTAYSSATDASAATMNAKTTYIFWDSEDEKATVVVGNNKLGDYTFGYASASDAVINVSETGALTAAYVFVMGNWDDAVSSTTEYGYVDFSKYTATKVDNKEVRTYTMTLVDGSTMSVTLKDVTFANYTKGLYKYNTDASVGAEYTTNVKTGVCASYADGVIVIGGVSYTVAEDAKFVDMSDEYNTAEDANIIAVTDKDAPNKLVKVVYFFD